MKIHRYEIRASFCEELVSLQVVGTREEAIERFEKRFPYAMKWYLGDSPEVWNYDKMFVTHEGTMEKYWKRDGYEQVLGPYPYPY